ncbi:MAG: hypothetical protein M0Q93_04095 [Terrimicrobiaceae bacterium]|nr:hypothetical protein [Terrimicrobiaceae bacterium]
MKPPCKIINVLLHLGACCLLLFAFIGSEARAGTLTIGTTPNLVTIDEKKFVFVDINGNINFTATPSDYSGDINKWKWIFENGQPDESTDQNPSNIAFVGGAGGKVNYCTVGLEHIDENNVTCQTGDTTVSTLHVVIPRFKITINAFIAANNLTSPSNSNRVYEGDNRSWDKNGSSRIHQTFDIIPVPAVVSAGVDNKSAVCGPSALYEKSSSLDGSGNLTSAARDDITQGTPQKIAWATATASCTATKSSTPATNKIVVSVEGSATNPVSIEPLYTPSIDYHMDITIDLRDPFNPTYTIGGTTDEFPSYDIYINKERVWSYSEAAGDPFGLFLEDNPIDVAGQIN